MAGIKKGDAGWFALLAFAGIFWFSYRLSSGSVFLAPNAGDIFTYIIFVPAAEELFFRGVLQDYVNGCIKRTLLSLTLANVIVSVIFALVHIPVWGGLHALLVFFPSLAFGFLYDKTGKLVYPILLHAIYNFNIFIV